MFLSIHVPKTGGSTFRTMLKLKFLDRMVYDYDKEKAVVAEKDFHKYDIIMGHYPPGRYNHMPKIAWVRDPVERVISHYFHFKRPIAKQGHGKLIKDNNLTAAEFAIHIPNVMSYYIDDYKQFTFIGIFEQWYASLARFEKIFGIHLDPILMTNVGTKEPVDEEQRKVIAKINDKDMDLYKKVCDEFWF